MKKLTYAMLMNAEVKVKEEDLKDVIDCIDSNNELVYDQYNRVFSEAGIYIADLEG